MAYKLRFNGGQTWREYERALLAREEKRSFQEWSTAKRSRSEHAVLREFSELLSVVLIFLAEGNVRKKTLATRAWVLLYAIRPDLIGGESMEQAAKRFGIESGEMCLVVLLRELRRRIPALNVDTSTLHGCAGGVDGKTRCAEKKAETMRAVWKARKKLWAQVNSQ